MTRTKGRPINWQDWTADGRFLMFLNDETGDENHHLFVVDPVDRSLRDLTPIASINAQLNRWSPDVPGEVAVSINDRDARWHDLYRIDLATGKRTLIWENTQELAQIRLDWQLRPRHARSNAPDGGAKLWRIEGTALRPWLDVPYEDHMTTWAGIFDRSNERVLLFTSMGRETAAFCWRDWATDRETLIAQHPKADCLHAVLHPTTYEIDAVAAESAAQEWIHVARSASRRISSYCRSASPDLSSVSRARRTTIAAGSSRRTRRSSRPPTGCLRRSRQAVPRGIVPRAPGALAPCRPAPMRTVQTKSRDGLDLVSYLTLPASVDAERPSEPLPMVLVVHGGPWSRDIYGYRGDHQWLADRGYAVLSVNYRGSTGFGKGLRRRQREASTRARCTTTL